MCIVVDACVAHHLINKTRDGRPVLRWLLDKSKRSALVLGGSLIRRELGGQRFLSVLAQLNQAGRIHSVDDSEISKISRRLQLDGNYKSNDHHVLALCIASRCNIVFTDDKLLHADLKSLGKGGQKIAIYKNSTHTHLLTACACPPRGEIGIPLAFHQNRPIHRRPIRVSPAARAGRSREQ